MSRLEDLLALRNLIDNEISRERSYLARRRELNERVSVALLRGTWSTRAFTATATYLGVDGDDILGRSLTHEHVNARHIAMWIMREGGETYSHIGRELGVDHSTVIHGVRRVNKTEALLNEAMHIHGLLTEVAA